MAEAGKGEPEIDLRDLLRRYMRHVAQCEGITFVDRLNAYENDTHFSPAEVEFLEQMDKELWPLWES